MAYNEVLGLLIEKFPKCFFRLKHLGQPLRLGIRDEIMLAMPEVDRIEIVRGARVLLPVERILVELHPRRGAYRAHW
jgi:hypothetical protein